MIVTNQEFDGESKDLNSYIHLYTHMPELLIKRNVKTRNKKILHYPQLDTVLMVEKLIKDKGGEFKKKSLWQHLPKKVMYQTFCVIFDYLTYSKKIGVDKVGHVCWIWDPEGTRKYFSRKDLSWK